MDPVVDYSKQEAVRVCINRILILLEEQHDCLKRLPSEDSKYRGIVLSRIILINRDLVSHSLMLSASVKVHPDNAYKQKCLYCGT
jgi:hypothetical protein